jgi:glutamyl-tRNA synthetase
MGGLKERAKTLEQLADAALFYVRERPLPTDEKAKALLGPDARAQLRTLADKLETLDPWEVTAVEAAVRDFAAAANLKLGQVAQPLRAALSGATTSPGIFEVAAVLGRSETIARIRDAAV